MRKLFLLAGVVAAMASCTKNDVSNVNLGNPDIITVGTYVDQATKGTIFDNTAVKESGFGIMAYYTGQSVWDNESGFTPDFMYNQKVEYNVAANAWSYSPIKYWPNEESDKVSFFTYAPYPDGENGVNSAYTANDEAGVPQVEFTLQEDAVDMIDFVAGQKMDKERQKDVVKFNMKHQLTRATFSACTVVDNVDKGADADGDGASYVVVKSMDVKDSDEFYSEGIYTFNNISTDANKAEHGQDGTWAVSSPIAYSFATIMDDEEPLNFGGYAEKGVAIPIAQNNFTSLFADDQYLFLLPPNGADGLTDGGIQVEIVYDIVTVDSKMAKGYTATESTYTVTLPAGTLAQGKAYNYQLQFDVTEILVNANIVDWDDEDENVSGGTIDPFEPTIDEDYDITVDDSLLDDLTTDNEGEVIDGIVSGDDAALIDRWESTVPEVATVDQDGKVTIGSTAGITTINGYIGDELVVSYKIVVGEGSGSGGDVSTDKEELTTTFSDNDNDGKYDIKDLFVDESVDTDVTSNPDATITWTSSNDNIATVDADGVVTGVAGGKATITGTTVNGALIEFTVEVWSKLLSFDASTNDLEVKVGEAAKTLTFTAVFQNYVDPDYREPVTNESVDTNISDAKVSLLQRNWADKNFSFSVDVTGLAATSDNSNTVAVSGEGSKSSNVTAAETCVITVTAAAGKFDDYTDAMLISGNYVTSDGTLTTNSSAYNVIGKIIHVDRVNKYALAIAKSGYSIRGGDWANNTYSLLSNCSNANNGYYNMEVYARVCNTARTIWSMSRVEALSDSSDESKGKWYVPSKNEVYYMTDEGSDKHMGSQHYKSEWTESLSYAGLSNVSCVWSSTQINASTAYGTDDVSTLSQRAKETPYYFTNYFCWIPVIRF